MAGGGGRFTLVRSFLPPERSAATNAKTSVQAAAGDQQWNKSSSVVTPLPAPSAGTKARQLRDFLSTLMGFYTVSRSVLSSTRSQGRK
jgi:hypothetical protein